jgi:hypothetical protein
MSWHPLNRTRANNKTVALMLADKSDIADGLATMCDEMEASKCPVCRLVDGYHKEECWVGRIDYEDIDYVSDAAIAKAEGEA